jgi:hypothetical protein
MRSPAIPEMSAPPPARRRPGAQVIPEMPPVTGQVVAYQAGKSITIEVRQRNGQTRQTEFSIVDGMTKIELSEAAKEISVGMTVSVSISKDDPKLAAAILAGNAPNARRPAGRGRNPQPASNELVPSVAARPPVAGLSPGAVARQIDEHVETKQAAEKTKASPLCDDAEFIRRVYLDIVGVVPPPSAVVAFLDSQELEKRARLIDDLLARPEYGLHFGELWSERIVARDLPVNPQPFIRWLADYLNQGRGWNEIVFNMVTADGSFTPIRLRAPGAAHNSPALFILANSEDNQPRPDRLAGASAGLFLGAQIQCAECHNHPFAKWKQTDFWGMAAFFGQLSAERGTGVSQWNEAAPAADKPAEIVIPSTALKSVGKTVEARFLQSDDYRPGEQTLLRKSLARWMTAPENPFFAKATANRMWAHFFGRGLVNPVDDLHEDNPPSHPAILRLLADELRKSEDDLKHLIRCLCLSQTYQRTSQSRGENRSNGDSYSHMTVKVIGPGALYNSLTLVTGFRELTLGLPRSKSKQGVTTALSPRDAFVDFFRSQGEEATASDYTHGIPQALKLLNAEQLNRVAPAVERLVRSGLSRDQLIEQLYLSAFSRRATAQEARLITDFLDRRPNAAPAESFSAVLWTLINSSEFVLNH